MGNLKFPLTYIIMYKAEFTARTEFTEVPAGCNGSMPCKFVLLQKMLTSLYWPFLDHIMWYITQKYK